MGHRRKSTTYKLTFDDTHGEELAGLEVITRGASHDQLFDIVKLGGITLDELLSHGIDRIRALCESFPSRMVDWNHEDENGAPIPCTAAAFLAEDYTFTIPIVLAWVNTVRAQPKSGDVVSSGRQTIIAAGAEDGQEDLADLPMNINVN